MQKSTTPELNFLSSKTHTKLMACAEEVHGTGKQFINYLLDDEIGRNQLLQRMQKEESNENHTSVQVIAERINRHFAVLSQGSEIYEYHAVFIVLLKVSD